MCLGETLGLGFVWDSDDVGFEEGGVTPARWWCDGWSVKESMATSIATEAGQTAKTKDRNERRKKQGGLGIWGFLNEIIILSSFK